MTDSEEKEQEIEAILVIRTSDQTLFDEIKFIFPNEDDITVAKRAVGGIEIKGWFILAKGILAHHPSVFADQRGGSGRALRMRRAI